MSRRHITFNCEGATLFGSIDAGQERTGLLIVSGGNELRSGPWSSQALIAEKVAAAGFPVFRFDRRGVGDSEGENQGFAASGPDIAAAIAAFRAHLPTLRHIVGFGNCDAASALMLTGGAGLGAMLLANPWTFEPEPEQRPAEPAEADPAPTPMPPSVLRRHYLKRLTDPRAVWRLLTGQVKVRKMAAALAEAAKPDAPASSLAEQMAASLAGFGGPATILLADNDRTAQAFLANWDRSDSRLRRCPDASHSFSEPQARIWLQGQILAALRSLG